MNVDWIQPFPSLHAGAPTWHPRGDSFACWYSRGVGERVALVSSTGQVRDEWEQRATSLAWSPDGLTLAIGRSTPQVALWDCEHGKSRRVLRTVNRHVTSVAFSPGGGWIYAAATGANLFELATGARAVLADWGGPVVFAGESEVVLLGEDGLYLARSADRTHVRCLTRERPCTFVASVAGCLLASALRDAQGSYVVSVRDLPSGALKYTLPSSPPGNNPMLAQAPALDFSADGSVLAVGHLHEVHLHDGRTGALRRALSLPGLSTHDGISAVRLRPDGVQAAVATIQLRLWLASAWR